MSDVECIRNQYIYSRYPLINNFSPILFEYMLESVGKSHIIKLIEKQKQIHLWMKII